MLIKPLSTTTWLATTPKIRPLRCMYVACANIIGMMQTALRPSNAQQTASFDTARSARLGLRSSEAQLAVLRRAAEVAHKSLTDFILDSACLAAEQTLLDQRLFMVSGQDYQALLDLLDRPARSNAGLKKLFSQPAPWEKTIAQQAAKAPAKKPAAPGTQPRANARA